MSAAVTVPYIDYQRLELTTASDHFKNLIRPTLTTKEQGWDKFLSLSGRGICIVRMAEYAINVPFRIAKTLALIIYNALEVFRHLLLLPFNNNYHARELKRSFSQLFSGVIGAALMPLSIPLDITKLALGIVIHPAIAIDGPKERRD